MIRRFFLPAVTLLSALVFVGRLISLQLLNSSYKLLSDGNAVIENSIYPERGYIYDRNHKLLVSNQPVYDLMAIPENIAAFDTLELSKILGVSKPELKDKIKSARTFSVKLPSIIVGRFRTQCYNSERFGNTPVIFCKSSVRNYPVSIASNLLGYAKSNKNDMKRRLLPLGELIGRQGRRNIMSTFERKKERNFIKRPIQPNHRFLRGGKYDVPVKVKTSTPLTGNFSNTVKNYYKTKEEVL